MTVCGYLCGAGGNNGNEIRWNGGDGSGTIGLSAYQGSYLTATSMYGPTLSAPHLARRPFGTGTRALLDRLLAEAGIAPASVTGPQAASHLEVAMSVASGQADTGLGVRAAATALGLGFVPVTWEDFDIVLSGDALPAAEPLIAALRTPAVQSPVGALGGYDLSRAGSVDLLA